MSEEHDSQQGPILAAGTPVIFVDRKHRRYYDILRPKQHSNARGELIAHDDAIGRPDGCAVISRKGNTFDVLSAGYAEHVLGMKRQAQIIYPKDTAQVLMGANVQPGELVVEGGFGSGAMSIALLRAVGPAGRVVTYELNPEALPRAVKSMKAAFGSELPENHTVRVGNIYEGIEERGVDRIVLDVPEPWTALPHCKAALRGGGAIAIYVPTTLQLQQAVMALKRIGGFTMIEAKEFMEREWHVSQKSVRPKSQMVGHTGFLIFARRAAPWPPKADEAEPTDETAASEAETGEGAGEAEPSRLEAPAEAAASPDSTD